MPSYKDDEAIFSENNINFARQVVFRNCLDGSCSNESFLTFIRKASVQTSLQISNWVKTYLSKYY